MSRTDKGVVDRGAQLVRRCAAATVVLVPCIAGMCAVFDHMLIGLALVLLLPVGAVALNTFFPGVVEELNSEPR
ncbi:MAG: hypothetical protein QG626_674 [Patescibacteria group bacterium]|nr:hypothetical protein [Patescibacteria group bacterium]